MARVFGLAAGAALSALLAVCETPPAIETPTQKVVPSVGVFLDFDSTPGKTSLEVMKKEVASLLKPSGVAVDWRLASENRGVESFTGLVVLKFKGKCKVESWSQSAPDNFAPASSWALGSTKVVDGQVQPFSEVKCDAVKQALSYLPPEANPGERQKALGLAMGRVVAHELYHVLAHTTAHAARGLAQAVESLPDLVSSQSMPFGAEDSAAIRKALTK